MKTFINEVILPESTGSKVTQWFDHISNSFSKYQNGDKTKDNRYNVLSVREALRKQYMDTKDKEKLVKGMVEQIFMSTGFDKEQDYIMYYHEDNLVVSITSVDRNVSGTAFEKRDNQYVLTYIYQGNPQRFASLWFGFLKVIGLSDKQQCISFTKSLKAVAVSSLDNINATDWDSLWVNIHPGVHKAMQT